MGSQTKMAKSAGLTMQKELNIKVENIDVEKAHELSNIIQGIAPEYEGLWSDTLSSIKENSSDFPS